jgi:hypothetical protein
MSPQNTRSPAVTSAEPLPGTVCEWIMSTLPVDKLTLAIDVNFLGSAPGRMTCRRGPKR